VKRTKEWTTAWGSCKPPPKSLTIGRRTCQGKKEKGEKTAVSKLDKKGKGRDLPFTASSPVKGD